MDEKMKKVAEKLKGVIPQLNETELLMLCTYANGIADYKKVIECNRRKDQQNREEAIIK